LVQVANSVVKSDKYPECKERYHRLKARRGHKKAIIAICRMLLTAIWHILSDGEPYSPEGYFTERPLSQTQVLTTQQALNLLKSRGFIIKDDPSPLTG
ncbi:MAG: IS110 family transposase, partial [Ruminococcus flavefaciens]|nr:IS110 family transposase [Ruminococcus flavefaciens]